MKLRFLVPTLAALLAVGACKGKDKDSDTKPLAAVGEKAKELAKSGMSAANEAPAPDVAQTNKLWAIAPANTVMGLVAAPGAASKLHSMMMNIVATAEARPLGAKVLGELRKESKSEVIDAFDPASIRGAGIDLNGAAAVFMVAKKEAYIVLPVTDREAFRKVTKGTVETVDGVEFDRIEEDLVCAPKSDRYLCASTTEMLKGFGDKVDGALAKQVAELPSEYRGHAEIVMDIPGMAKVDDDFATDFDGQMSDPKLGIGAIRLGNGSVTIRGWFQVNPLNKLAAAVGVPNTLVASLGANKPSSILGFRMPMDAIIAEIPNKEEKLAGLDLKKDVMGNFTGEFVGYTPQSEALWGRLAMGIKDPAPFKTLLNMGCGMAPALGIPGIKVTPGDGKCSAMIDVAQLPLPDKTIAELFEKPVSIIAEVKADRFELTLGTEAPGTDKPISAMGSELMSKSWNFSMWAEGMGITSGATDLPWKQIPETVEAETVDGIKMGLWILAQVYEVGMAGAVRDDGIHGVFHLGTYAGDSPEAFKAYQAAVTAALASGTATAEFDAIREKWPNSMAARGGTGAGSMMITAVTGVVAAVAVPAFMKYKQESMKAAERFEEKSTAMEPVKK
tara:strand:- start:61429 stop:63279 length:1851 start_codon:yes stop_codon:yes gene_type:complete